VLKKEFSLDTNRLYVTGLSGGAMGAWSLLREHPGMFAAAVPCAGSTWGNLNVTVIVQTPFWAFHGSADETVPVSGSRDIVSAVEKLGYPVVRFVSSANRVNPTGISYDSLTRAVYGGAKYLYSEITGGNHFAGWNEAWAHPLLPHWVLSKTRGTTAAVSLPCNATAASSPAIIRSSGITSVRIPPSWRAKSDAVAIYTVCGRRLGRAGISDNTIIDLRARGYGPGILFVKPIVTK
ncbi:MAG: hypothetical protein JXA71_18135, partial [Chitinispirillaceae bacterium]|nr:hypothetical protein [Chitinispirillaceae bacterium]